MDEMAQRVAIVRGLSRRLQERLSRLSQDEWRHPSACALWEVRDVVAHLTGGAERQMESIRRGQQGNAGPPADFAPVDVPTMSARNAQRDIQRRDQLGDRLLSAFIEQYDRLDELLAGIDGQGWETPCWHQRRGTMTAREYVELRIQELAIHDWDIRSAFEPDPRLDPESVPVLLDIAPTWLWMSFRPGPRLDAPVVYRFQVSGATPRSHQVTVWGDSFQVGPAGEATADVTVRCAPEPYLLFMYGRLSASAGAASGRLSIEGDASLLQRFEEWFKGL